MWVGMGMMVRKGKMKVLVRRIQKVVKNFRGVDGTGVMGKTRIWVRMRILGRFWKSFHKIQLKQEYFTIV